MLRSSTAISESTPKCAGGLLRSISVTGAMKISASFEAMAAPMSEAASCRGGRPRKLCRQRDTAAVGAAIGRFAMRRRLPARPQVQQSRITSELGAAGGIPLRARLGVEADDELGAAARAERVQHSGIEGPEHDFLVEHREVAVLAQALGDLGLLRNVANVRDGSKVDRYAGETPGLAPAGQRILVGATRGVVGLGRDAYDPRDRREHDEEVEPTARRERRVQVPAAVELGRQAALPVGQRHLLEDRVAQEHGALDDAPHGWETLVLAGAAGLGEGAG